MARSLIAERMLLLVGSRLQVIRENVSLHRLRPLGFAPSEARLASLVCVAAHRARLLMTASLFLAVCHGSAIPQTFTYGLRAGPSWSRFVGEPNWAFRVGGLAGVVGRLQVYDAFAVQLELLAHRRGGNGQLSGGQTVILDYLEFPILARLQLYGGRGHNVHVAGYAGPASSLQLSCRCAEEDPEWWAHWPPGVLVPCSSRQPLVSIGVGFVHTRNVMIDAVGGFELGMRLGTRTAASLDFRYQRSLLTIDRNDLPGAWSETLGLSFAVARTIQL